MRYEFLLCFDNMEIQKIFSDMYDEERLYSVLLTEDEMMLFSELTKGERFNRWTLKHLNTKTDRDYVRALAEDDEEKASKASKKKLRRDALIGGGISTIGGAAIGGKVAGKKGAAIGAGLGLAAGGVFAGAQALGDYSGRKLRHKLNKKDYYKKFNRNVINDLDLAEGKISEEEYLKNKKKINKK